MAKKTEPTKVELFRKYIKEGKTLKEAIALSGVKESTAKTQMYKLKREESERQ